jgi:hypothetical protein
LEKELKQVSSTKNNWEKGDEKWARNIYLKKEM